MIKKQKEGINKSLKHMRTTVLEGIKDQLCRWDDNHGKVKASYFWSPLLPQAQEDLQRSITHGETLSKSVSASFITIATTVAVAGISTGVTA